MAPRKKPKDKKSPPSGTSTSSVPTATTTTTPTTNPPKRVATGTTTPTVPSSTTTQPASPPRTMPPALSPLGGPPVPRATTTTSTTTSTTVPKRSTTTSVPAKKTTTIPTGNTVVPVIPLADVENTTIETPEQFKNKMVDLLRLVRSWDKRLKESVVNSTDFTEALNNRDETIKRIIQTQIIGYEKFGTYGVSNGKPTKVYAPPAELTNLLGALNDPRTIRQAAATSAKMIIDIPVNTGRLDDPGHYRIPIQNKDIEIAKQVGLRGAGPAGPTGPGIQASPTGPTGATGATGPIPATGAGTPTAVGTVRTVKGTKQTWDGTKWTTEKKVVTKKVDWEPKFRELFPTQSWLLDLDRTKYPSLFKLLQTGVQTGMGETTEGQARFAEQLQGTDFFVELKTDNTVQNIKNLVGDLGFDTIPFNSFLKDTMNYGWKGDTLKQKVYEEAFRKDPSTGAYINTTTIERVRKSTPYLDVAKVGKTFFNTVSDDTVANVLTGSMIQDDVIRQQRELAKGKYAHLSNLIDQGLTLEDIADSYKTQASRLLEKDPNAIDMSQGAYSTAFDFGEEGKKRLMSTSEWETKLRSDATFGWDKTQNARDEARALASSISQAFGRVI